jgi:hypothetical protein
MAITHTRDKVTMTKHTLGHLKSVIAPGTSDLTAGQSGSLISTEGAGGAITFTLPAVATSAGVHYWFQNAEDQNMIITGPANLMTTFNDITATSIAFQTSSEKVGGGAFAICDGSKWHVQIMTYDGADQLVTIS